MCFCGEHDDPPVSPLASPSEPRRLWLRAPRAVFQSQGGVSDAPAGGIQRKVGRRGQVAGRTATPSAAPNPEPASRES